MPRRLGGGRGDKRRDRETERMIRELKRSDPLLVEKSRSRSPHSKDSKPVEVKKEEPKPSNSSNGAKPTSAP